MDDLITRLRTLMAEVEARIQQGDVLSDEDISPKLQEALRLPAVRADDGAEPKPRSDPPMTSKTYGPGTAEDNSASRARQIKLDDYVPYEGGPNDDVYPADDFIGTGDTDPLGHDEAIRR